MTPNSSTSAHQYATTETPSQGPASPVTVNKGENETIKSNEGSPLLSPVNPNFHNNRSQSEDSLDDLDWQGGEEETEPSKSIFYLIILTLSIGGLQISWATELSNGSPYLQSLGMSKSLLSFVWIAGPLAGVLVRTYSVEFCVP